MAKAMKIFTRILFVLSIILFIVGVNKTNDDIKYSRDHIKIDFLEKINDDSEKNTHIITIKFKISSSAPIVIRNIYGRITITDIYGTELHSTNVDISENIAPNSSKSLTYSLSYPTYGKIDENLQKIYDSDRIRVKFEISRYRFSDGKTIRLDSDPKAEFKFVSSTGGSSTGGSSTGGSSTGGSSTHTHNFTQKSPTSDYLKSAATCTQSAVYYYKCTSCTAMGTTTYSYGDIGKHDFSKKITTQEYLKSAATSASDAVFYYKCIGCSEKGTSTYTYHSEGLEYSLSTDKTYCYVSGIGTCTDKNIVIPYTYNGYKVTSIGYEAFYYCTGLTSITIGNSVTSIGDYAFYGCTGLTSITIPNSVTMIGYQAFKYCTGLTSITIPNSVTSIGNYAFYYCTGLTSVTIPNSVKSIGNDAFSGCTGLTSITIPNSVTSIGNDAFYNCKGLTSITIPNSVTSIGNDAFYNCKKLTSIKYRGTQTQWNAITKGSLWNYNTGNYKITYNYTGE